MTESPELTALRQKLNQFETELEGHRNVIQKTQTQIGVLAGMKSDCLKVIARLTIKENFEKVKTLC